MQAKLKGSFCTWQMRCSLQLKRSVAPFDEYAGQKDDVIDGGDKDSYRCACCPAESIDQQLVWQGTLTRGDDEDINPRQPIFGLPSFEMLTVRLRR